MMNDDIEFRDDTEGLFQEKVLLIKEIILRQIRKIGDISSKEFTGGYWEKKPIRTTGGIMFSEVYHDDVREAYCNAVDFLVDIVYPMGDDILKEYLQKYENFKEEIEGEIENEPKMDINKKLKLKRQTFRQINLMFERTNFWKGVGNYNE